MIVGDLSPKNIGLRANGVAVCDFDGAHSGRTEFDVGYLLGQIIVNDIHRPGVAIEHTQALLDGIKSGRHLGDEEMITDVAMATAFYRVALEDFWYPLPLTAEGKKLATDVVLETIRRKGSSLEELCTNLDALEFGNEMPQDSWHLTREFSGQG